MADVCVFQVVGLGNPGMESTRHSVGMAVLGALASRLGADDRWRSDKHVSGEVIVSEVQHTHVVLLRPRLLMNVNGVSVAKAGEVTASVPVNRRILCYAICLLSLFIIFEYIFMN